MNVQILYMKLIKVNEDVRLREPGCKIKIGTRRIDHSLQRPANRVCSIPDSFRLNLTSSIFLGRGEGISDAPEPPVSHLRL